MLIKDFLRSLLILLRIDVSKNIEYDRLTNKILKERLSETSNCIDVGCHKGEILRIFIKYANKGDHYAFEPIPSFYKFLKNKFSGLAGIYPYALSDKNGETSFQFVRNAPAYSGISKRKYKVEKPDIEEINVELRKLDDVLPSNYKPDFIKIDVEGAEFNVLVGAKKVLKKYKPTIIFEFGLGASDYYGTTPKDLYNFMANECGLKINTLKSYVKRHEALNYEEFNSLYINNKEYYFIAY